MSTNNVLFTSNNWNQVQTIKVIGVDDIQRDGDTAYSIITSNSSSEDPYYSDLEINDIAVTNIDSTLVPPPAGLPRDETIKLPSPVNV